MHIFPFGLLFLVSDNLFLLHTSVVCSVAVILSILWRKRPAWPESVLCESILMGAQLQITSLVYLVFCCLYIASGYQIDFIVHLRTRYGKVCVKTIFEFTPFILLQSVQLFCVSPSSFQRDPILNSRKVYLYQEFDIRILSDQLRMVFSATAAKRSHGDIFRCETVLALCMSRRYVADVQIL